NHPAVVALQQKLAVTEKGIDIAKQQYKPGWGINANYGYRGESPAGVNRSDFLSVGVTFDVPLFTKNRQDKQVQSAVAQNDAVETEELFLLRQMLANFKANIVKLNRLNERKKLYEKTLLPQMSEQAEASLSAYTNDTGDFAEVVRSRIAELNAQIDALNIAVDRQKIIAQLNYFFKQV
ncbi:MAG TPA: transporter, partial [Oceanospirillales bacterium]|nr:transporter [Oceanospirillales bacterium]